MANKKLSKNTQPTTQASNITTYTASEYYDAFIKFMLTKTNIHVNGFNLANPAYHHGIYKKEKIDDILIPFIALKLASIERIRSNIDALYQNLKLQSEERVTLPERVAGMRIPEIYYGLSMEGRAYYDKTVAVCLSSNAVITMQIARLLLKAYPEATISEDLRERIEQHYLKCYGPEGAAITYVESYLTGKVIPDDIALSFTAEAYTYCRLPMHNPFTTEAITPAQKELPLRQAIIQTEYSLFDHETTKHIEALRKDDKEPVHFMGISSMPVVKNPNAHEKWIRDMDAIRRKSKYVQALENRKDSGQVVAFLLSCLSVAGVSVDELMDKTLTTEDQNLISAIYYYTDPKWVLKDPDVYPEMPSDYLAAGGLILNTALALQEARMESEYFRSRAEAPSETQMSEPVSMTLSPELKGMQAKLNRLQKNLSENKTFIAKKEKILQKQLKQKDLEIEKLKQKLAMAEDLLSAYDKAERNEDQDVGADANTPLSEMVEMLNQKKIVFAGGHANWFTHLRSYLPNAIYVENGEYKKISKSVLAGADVIVYSTLWNSHGMYYACLKWKDADTPICIMSVTSAERSLQMIYDMLKRKQKS